MEFSFPYLSKPLESIKCKSKTLTIQHSIYRYLFIYLFYGCLHLLSKPLTFNIYIYIYFEAFILLLFIIRIVSMVHSYR